MAAHYVTCIYCKQRFNRDKEPFVQISARRYAHEECAKKHKVEQTQEEKDLQALEQYIMKLLDEPYVNARVKKQIKDFQKDYNFTYSGMLKSLVWFYDVKGNPKDKANGGIGIIPYVYRDAYNYYYSLFLAKSSNENKDIEEYKPVIKEISIFSPRVKLKQHKLFNLDNAEDGE